MTSDVIAVAVAIVPFCSRSLETDVAEAHMPTIDVAVIIPQIAIVAILFVIFIVISSLSNVRRKPKCQS